MFRFNFWLWLGRYCFKKVGHQTPKPIGIPLNRDPDNECTGYEPRKFKAGDWQGCQGDGHYLCLECVHFDHNQQDPEELDNHWAPAYFNNR